MESGRVEVRTIGPRHRAGFGVHRHTIESDDILKRLEHCAVEHGPKSIRWTVPSSNDTARTYGATLSKAVTRGIGWGISTSGVRS